MTKTHVAFCLTSAALLSSSISGCAGSRTQSENSQPLLVGDITETGSTSARPALLIENSALSRDALWPVLAEIAGIEAIRETVLDHAVSVELQRKGMTLTDADVEAERERLSDRLMPNGTEEESAEILRRVLEGRGLGPVRLGALLRRNAGMRKLIADDAVPSIEMVELAYKVRYGPQLHTRMISTATPHAAQQALQSIRSRSDESGLLIAFMEIAVERSTDQSSSLGGNLGPISPDDPGLPVAIRSVLANLEPMQLSSIVALDTGYAILLVESSTPASSITLEEVFENLEQEVRDRQERLLMDRLGQSLLSDYSPSVLDASLRWSWER